MKKQEIRIVTKIIRELTLFLMMHGHHQFSVDVSLSEDEMRLTYKVKHMNIDVLNTIKEKVNREREMEIETYGWELVGDLDSKSELEVVGLLIDRVEVKEEAENTELIFVRKEHKKSA